MKIVAEGLTAYDLMAADAVAQAAWIASAGAYRHCPRCGGSDERFHHPLCHTAAGIPLFPTYNQGEWLGEFTDHYSPWEGEITTG
jgi:hypothetical protein